MLARLDLKMKTKKVVLNITLPAVLLNAFASANYTTSALVLPGIMFLLCCLALALGFGIMRLWRQESRLSPYLASGFEAGMLGYTLFALLFPQKSISSFALLDLGQTLFVFTVFKFLLSGKTGVKAILQDMVTSPILWAVFAGVLLGATGGYIWGFLASALIYWWLCAMLPAKRGFRLLSMVAGQLVCYALGTLWYWFLYLQGGNAASVWLVLAQCVLPYLIPDGIKLLLAWILTGRLNRFVY